MARPDSYSQYSSDIIGIAVVEVNTATDADAEPTVTITRDADSTVVVTDGVSTRDGLGLYSYVLTLAVTATKGTYTAIWNWEIAGDAREFAYGFNVVDPQPFFDSMNADQKQLVDNVYHKVSDSFDSTVYGGPYLWELPQATFGYETIARLMIVDAMTYINYSSPKAFVPPYTIGADTPKPFPIGWYGLLERAAQYELFKHLSTSYIEVPDPINVDVARLDRQKYSRMWMDRADHEKIELDPMLKMLKREMRFGVKARSMLLAGGIFPVSYLNPARPRWPYVLSRFY